MTEERKSGEQANASQLTLDNYDEADETDSQYGHLTAHLVETEVRSADNNQWTRVFARSDIESLHIPVHALGPDVIYDRALRESAQGSNNVRGEVVFSPMLFKANDLNKELSACQISRENLLGLGEVAT